MRSLCKQSSANVRRRTSGEHVHRALGRFDLIQNGLAFVAEPFLTRWIVEAGRFLKLLVDLLQAIAVAFESLHVDHFADGPSGRLLSKTGQQRFKVRATKRNVGLGEQLLDVPVAIRFRCDLNLAVERKHPMFTFALEDVTRQAGFRASRLVSMQ